jgi:hypothetical protein
MNKRGQLFLLAAVILASLIVALSVTLNYARITKDDKNFHDLTYEVKKEGLEVVNYGVVNGNITGALADYSDRVGEYLADTSPETEILFIYGNATNVYVANYGKEITAITTDSDMVTAVGCNRALVGSIGVSVGGQQFISSQEPTAKDYYGKCSSQLSTNGGELSIMISNKVYNFTLGNDQKFVIVTKKTAGNETYLEIK